MDNFYVTPDGQIAALPKRSFMDRLTSGLYDASVEWRKPGGAQEMRLARQQPLTSALNRYGEQQRAFGQENAMIDKQQGFTGTQNALQRGMQRELSAAELAQAAELAKLTREQAARQFDATQGLREAERYDNIYNKNREFISEQEALPVKRALMESQILENRRQADAADALARARAMSSAMEGAIVSQEALAMAAALNKELQPFVGKPVGLTYGQLGTIGRLRPGTSGTLIDPSIFGGAPQVTGGGTSAVPDDDFDINAVKQVRRPQ